jgi:putative RecB family exonuclease
VLSLSPTKLRDYLTCPRLYKLKHLDRVASERASAPLSFGRSLHAALDELHKAGRERESENSDDAAALLLRHWEPAAYADARESEEYFSRGCEALGRYAESASAATQRVLGTEVFLSCVINFARATRIRFCCKADRVSVEEDGVLEVLDYKTGLSGRLPTEESLAGDLPNFIYYLLARIHYREYSRVRVSQLNVLSMGYVAVEYDEAQIAENKKGLLDRARAFAAGDFTPTPSEACAWCPVQEHCPVFNNEVDFDSLV